MCPERVLGVHMKVIAFGGSLKLLDNLTIGIHNADPHDCFVDSFTSSNLYHYFFLLRPWLLQYSPLLSSPLCLSHNQFGLWPSIVTQMLQVCCCCVSPNRKLVVTITHRCAWHLSDNGSGRTNSPSIHSIGSSDEHDTRRIEARPTNNDSTNEERAKDDWTVQPSIEL